MAGECIVWHRVRRAKGWAGLREGGRGVETEQTPPLTRTMSCARCASPLPGVAHEQGFLRGDTFCLRRTAWRMLWSAHRWNGALGAGCEAAVELRTFCGSPRVGCGRGQRTLKGAKRRVVMPLDESGRTVMRFVSGRTEMHPRS